AGAITQDQARARRRALERESQLFGSMDGAMKFVKGDVIAGLVITFINLLGGIVIGVVQNGMTAADAAGTYALIAIGDGLVSQIPSLAIAVAAGIVVTRVASEKEDDSLGTDIGAQFFGQHKALFVVAGLCLAFAAMPGMPHLTFVIIAALAVLVGLGLQRLRARPEEPKKAVKKTEDKVAPAQAPKLEDHVQAVTPLVLDLAADLTPLVEEDDQAFVHVDLNSVRERLFFELGIRVPAFRVRTGAPLQPRTYALAVDEVPAGRGQLPEGEVFALSNASDLKAAGLEATAAQDGLGRQIASVTGVTKDDLHEKGIPARTRRELLGDHLALMLRKRAATFLGVQEVSASLATLETQSPALVKEALQKVPLPLLTDVLKKLLQEQVSIRNLRSILDALVSPTTEGDAVQLAEKCRAALSRQISHQFAQNGPLFAWLVDPAVEETLRQGGTALDPADAGAIIEGVKRIARQGKGVLLASPDVRRMLRRLIEGAFPEVAVLTFSELDPELQVRPVGRLVAVAQ
ncbi:MAG: FHIPEP family type III secretion protein, partial [Myxococcota bacterium]